MIIGDRIRIENKDLVGTIILGRPQSLNVLDTETLLLLRDALAEIEKDDGIRVVIITGDGHFCAGADIRELREKDFQAAKAFSQLGHEVFNHIENMGKPVVAAVMGYALGGGSELALACDIRIAGEGAKFGLPEVNLGLVPGFGGTQRLARLVGAGKAKELILTGKIIAAQDAESIGLVNIVVKDAEVMPKAMEMARVLSEKSPLILKMAKGLINENPDIQKGLAKEISSFAACFETEDHLERIKAFLEKRKPEFKGNRS
jgi:enoyl-CoA hydratase